ncbi:MAG: N-acetylmuramoyl-L-alanine amidase [Spirochaetaceae bacterium]|jgi:N-acetylmuramoyl-L-alanine amidase|nr:N-acetylmuramoyl-L-alanine amidase [Spirochaetaceae bacterium]
MTPLKRRRGIFLFLMLFFAVVLSAQKMDPPVPEKNLTLDETLSRLGAELSWDPFFHSGVLSVSGHYAVFEAGNAGEEGFLLVDGRDLLWLPTPYLEKGVLWFPETLVVSLKGVLDAAFQEDRSRFRIAAIILDPGHGGKDTGAVGNHVIDGKPVRVVEKDITLKVARDIHARLTSAFPDKQILLTRDNDTYPTLENRVTIANSVSLKENEAILFISIHANASLNKHARGYEVWYLTPEYRRTLIDEEKYDDSAEIISIRNAMLEEEFTTESIMMAQFIMNRFNEQVGSLLPSRGIKAEEWFVVRNARMPSVLVELGFVTNEEDTRLMTNDIYLKNFSGAIYYGILDFVTMFERSGGFTTIP